MRAAFQLTIHTASNARHVELPERIEVLMVHYSINKNMAPTLDILNMAPLRYIFIFIFVILLWKFYLIINICGKITLFPLKHELFSITNTGK
jgi:hypothetical protein